MSEKLRTNFRLNRKNPGGLVELSYMRYLERISQRKTFFPSRVTVELTNKCNLKCKMCPRNYQDVKYGFMRQELFEKIIDDMALFGPLTLVPFFRGEPLLHPKFLEFISYVKRKKNIQIQLATNATLLDTKTADRILRLGIDFISFSLDSTKKEEYERIRRDSDYDRVIEYINNFIKKKKRQKLKLPEIQVSIVKTQENQHLIKEFIRHWINQVDRVRVYYEHSQRGTFGKLKLSDQILKKRRPCLKPLTDIVVYWDGTIALCNHDWKREGEIGMIKSTIEQVWNSSKYHKIRLMHYNRKITDKVCKNCDQWMCYYLPKGIIGELYFGSQKNSRSYKDEEIPYTYNQTLL